MQGAAAIWGAGTKAAKLLGIEFREVPDRPGRHVRVSGIAQHIAATPDSLDIVLAACSFFRTLQMKTSMILSSGSSMPP